MLSNERINQLSEKKNVKKIAVQNFLWTLSSDIPMEYTLENLNMDARLYKWNTATVNAIKTGIKEFYKCLKK